MSLYNVERDKLLGKPSIESMYCPFCGRLATNRHHILPKGMGGTKNARLIPTITVCGMGNASGCHGRLHAHEIEIRWSDELDWYEYRRPGKGCGQDEWRRLDVREEL